VADVGTGRSGGGGGPNAACEACVLLVATRIDDCSLWQAVWLAPDAEYPVPLPFGIWLWLVFPEPPLPYGVLCDDLPMPRPRHLFRVDPAAFRRTLVRLPAVRTRGCAFNRES
jgi:hypothetical protein